MKLRVAWLALLLSACTVGPKYQAPVVQVPMPPAYKEAGDWKPADPSDQLEKGKWWELFHDAQLNELEEQIAVSNQNLKAAAARYDEARALERSDRAGFFPTLTGAASITGTKQSDNRPIAHSNFNDYLMPFTFSYEADVWGRVKHSVESSTASAQATAADLETLNLSLHAELAFDYFQLHGLDAEKQLLDSTVSAYAQALQLTQNRFNGGIATEADVAQAQTQLETVRAQAVDVEVDRAQLEHAIAILTGKTPSGLSVPALALTTPPPAIPLGLPSELLERRPDIAAAERRIAAANAEIGVARSAFFPILSLVAPAGFEGHSIGTWLSVSSLFWSAGPSIAATLFDGGKRRAVSDQTQAAYQAAAASYQQTVLSAFGDVEDSLSALHILADEAQVQDGAVAAAEHSLAVSTNRYKGGVATYLEVITAQSIALTNERVAVGLLTRRMTSSVQLIKALGGGWKISDLPAN